MKTKIIILISFIYSFAAFGFEAAAVQAPPVPGVGIVIKRNPGGGASKVVSGKDGSFSMELTKGSYLVSLNQDQLMKVGQELVKTYSPKSKYQFNGDGTQMLITENENIIMSQLEGTIAQDLMLITVTQNTTLQGSLLWDNSVVEQPQGKSANYKGHVTLIRRSAASQNLQVFCPTGTIGMDGKCVSIKELENLPIAQTTDYIGHVTLLKKNAQSIAVASTDRTEGEPLPGLVIKGGSNGPKSMVAQTNTTDYVGHVTLLRFSQLYLGGGLQMPSSTTKEGANSINGIDFNIGYYHPIWAWEKSMISLGLNAELGYRQGIGSHNLDNQYTIYNLGGQSQLPTTTERGVGPPGREAGFRGAAGLQMNVHLGDKFTLSPIINAGYLSTTHKSFSVTETVYYNGSAYNYDLLSQKESKTSGLGILPKLRMTYNITPRIGIWLEGNYTMGPKIKTETTRFVLDPTIPSDSYNLGHFAEGQYITTKKETSYSAVGVNGGIVVSLGKPKGDKPTVGTLNPPPTTNPNPPLSTPTTSGGTVPTSSSLQSNEKCVEVISPDYGSKNSNKEEIQIKGKTLEGVNKVNVAIYKISDDENLFRNSDDKTKQKYFADDFSKGKVNSLENDSKIQKIINSDVFIKNNEFELKGNKLTNGAYRLVVSSEDGCQNTVSNFTVANDDCDVNHRITKTTDECNGIYENGGFRHRICFTSNYTSSNCDLTYSQTGSGLKVYDSSMNLLSYTTVSGFPLQTQNQGTTTNVTYCIDVVVPSASTNVILALQGDSCPNMAVSCKPGAQKKMEVKNCACKPCEQNNVTATIISSRTTENDAVINTKIIASPNTITKIQADIVYIGLKSNNLDCVKCDNKTVQQGVFHDINRIVQGDLNLWKDTGKGFFEGENPQYARSITFNSADIAGVNLNGAGTSIRHTIGLPPVSCCGDEVEVWIRYTVWDKECHVCDKLVKTTLTRKASCDDKNNSDYNPNNSQDTNTNNPRN